MGEIRFDIDQAIAGEGHDGVRCWTVSLNGAVVAHHETLGAALAAATYQCEVELRRDRDAKFAVVSIPLPSGGRSEMYCAPSRDRVSVLAAQGAAELAGAESLTT
jgi:hypothetical protein